MGKKCVRGYVCPASAGVSRILHRVSLGVVEGEGGVLEITRDAEGKLPRTCGSVLAVAHFLAW